MTTHTTSHRLLPLLALAAACLLAACATTGGTAAYGPPPIPEGKGRLRIEAGGINELNFYVEDAETGDIVYEDMPLAAAYSPSAYERSWSESRLVVDLDPGTYDVVVNTHIEESVVQRGVVVQMGQEVYAPVRVGRLQIVITGDQQMSRQIPFQFLDYNMRTVLGRGMTTGEVRYFILPVGRYKIRLENTADGIDEMRPVDVAFGRPTPLYIELGGAVEEDPNAQQEGQQP